MEAFETAAQFVILIRLWRLVRIVNGAFLSSKTQSDRKLQQARVEARKIIHAFHKCQDKLDQAEVLVIPVHFQFFNIALMHVCDIHLWVIIILCWD